MKLIFAILTLFLLLTSCSNSLTPLARPQITGNIKSDVVNMLPLGTVTAEIMNGEKKNHRYKKLAKTYSKNIDKNVNWFIDYTQTVPKGQPVSYHSNFGLTEIEYKELQEYFNNREIISSGTKKIIITKQDDIIQFKSSRKLAILDLIKINLKSNKVEIGENTTLSYKDTINVTDETRGLKSKWSGYIWRFQDNINPDEFYEFTLGRLKKNGKTIMIIKIGKVKDGVKFKNYELPIIF